MIRLSLGSHTTTIRGARFLKRQSRLAVVLLQGRVKLPVGSNVKDPKPFEPYCESRNSNLKEFSQPVQVRPTGKFDIADGFPQQAGRP